LVFLLFFESDIGLSKYCIDDLIRLVSLYKVCINRTSAIVYNVEKHEFLALTEMNHMKSPPSSLRCLIGRYLIAKFPFYYMYSNSAEQQ